MSKTPRANLESRLPDTLGQRSSWAPWSWWGTEEINATDGPWFDAPPGSVYTRRGTTSTMYIKRSDNGVAADWQPITSGVIDAQTFGAKGDGVTDDTVAIQAALTAASVTGGEVYLPAGSYLISASLTISSFVTLQGARGSTSRIFPAAKTFPAITVTGAQQGWRIADIAINYGSESSENTAIGIKTVTSGGNAPSKFVIERVTVTNAYQGMQFSSVTFMGSVRDSFIHLPYSYGVSILGGTTYTLQNVYVVGGGGGFSAASVTGLALINCAVDDVSTTTQMVNTFTGCAGQLLGFFTEGNVLGGEGFALLYFNGCRMLVQGWTSLTNTFSTTLTATAAARVTGTTSRMMFVGCTSSGDTISAGDHHVVWAIQGLSWFYGCNWAEPTGMTNKYYGGAWAQIWDTARVDKAGVAFSVDDDTPDVSSGNSFYTANAHATTITNFDGGVAGQRITVLIADNNTTLDFTGTNLKGNGAADWTPATGDWLEAWTPNGTTWYCAAHDCT